MKTQETTDKKNIRCPVAKRCGGCQYSGVPYKTQLQKKQQEMEELFSPFCKVLPILGMEHPEYYRNKVHHVFGRDNRNNIISGTYEERSHIVVNVDHCLLEDEKSQEIIHTIRKLAKSFKLKIYDEDTGFGLLRHVLVRRGFTSGEIMVVLVLSSPILPGKNNFVKALREEHPEITTIILNVNDRSTSMVLGDRNITLYGPGFIKDRLLGCTFRISPSSFYQVNPRETEVLYETAIKAAALTGKETVLDAYCGIGTIGLTAAKYARQVIGVELNKEAVKDAVLNAKENRTENIRFFQADASDFITDMAEAGEKADVIFMDPPRTGSTEKFIEAAAKLAPKRIVYVSCGPDTLARDLEVFIKKGYKPQSVQPVDMFPWTEHVETVCLLSHQKNKYVSVPYEPEDDEYMKDLPGSATYPEIKEYILSKYNAKVSSLYIAQVKDKVGIDKRENYNKPKSAESRQPQVPKEKEAMIMDALEHFNMIP